jgi:anti-sigma factor RsiW
MSCERWNEAILGRLYDETEPDQDRALESHLEGCAACRASVSELRRLRAVLRENEPEVPRAPRVVVLRDAARFRPALLAASLAGAALLAGAGAGAGYAVGRQAAPETAAPTTVAAAPASLDPATEALVRKEVESRWAALTAALPPKEAEPTSPAVSQDDLQAAFAKFEGKLYRNRADELDYLLGQIEASEVRTGARIGQTNQALRYVALASNPNVSER